MKIPKWGFHKDDIFNKIIILTHNNPDSFLFIWKKYGK